jgi:hypothetical protein
MEAIEPRLGSARVETYEVQWTARLRLVTILRHSDQVLADLQLAVHAKIQVVYR